MGRNSLDIQELYEKVSSNDLIQTEKDIDIFRQLHDVILKNKFTFITVLKSKKHYNIMSWICSKTPMLDDINFEYTIGTRLVWVYLGLMNFQKCPVCGKEIGHHTNTTFTNGYPTHCSAKCVGSDSIVIISRENTCIKRFGVRNPFQNEDIKRKSGDTIEKKFGKGIRHISQTAGFAEKTRRTRKKHAEDDPLFQEKINEKTRITKLTNGRPVNWNNREKACKTHKDRTGYDWPSQNPETRKKTYATCLERYGAEKIGSIREFKEKRVETFREQHNGIGSAAGVNGEITEKARSTYEKNTGYRTPFQNPDIIPTIAKKNIEKYGNAIPARSDEVKAKTEKTRIERYGTRCIPSARYEYEEMRFDSSAELAYWICKTESGTDIRRGNEEDRLEFEFKGKLIGYYCDFVENGIRIELKGDHFFRQDGTMFCPFRKKSQTDEQYADLCDLYEAKHQCMLLNNVKILRYSSNEVQAAIAYVEKKYGKDYMTDFRI